MPVIKTPYLEQEIPDIEQYVRGVPPVSKLIVSPFFRDEILEDEVSEEQFEEEYGIVENTFLSNEDVSDDEWDEEFENDFTEESYEDRFDESELEEMENAFDEKECTCHDFELEEGFAVYNHDFQEELENDDHNEVAYDEVDEQEETEEDIEEELEDDFYDYENADLEEAFFSDLKKQFNQWAQNKKSGSPMQPLSKKSPGNNNLKLPIVSTFLPDSSNYLKAKKSSTRYYGIPETIEALQWIGKEWVKLYSQEKFVIMDISQKGGGKLKDSHHKSHRMGIDVDVHISIDGKPIQVGTEKPSNGKIRTLLLNKNYSDQRKYVRDFIEIVIRNPKLKIKTIGFRDQQLIKEFPRIVSDWNGHVKHLHLRFCLPDHRKSELNINKVYLGNEKQPVYECNNKIINASTPKKSSLNIQDAITYNEQKKHSLGWAIYRKQIQIQLGLTVFNNDDIVFVKALASWQAKNNFNSDGKLGPQTWNKMKNVLGIPNQNSTNPSTNANATSNINSAINLPIKKHPKRGYRGYGGGKVMHVLSKLKSQGKLSISNADIELLQRMSNVESRGEIQGINSFDNAFMSFGFLQWPILYDNKHGGKLQRLVKIVPKTFSKYGIELDHSRTWRFKRQNDEYISIAFKDVQSANEFRSYEWAKRFYLAGIDMEIIVAEAELALQVIEESKKRIINRVGDFFLPYYQNSNVLRALIQESFNHRPAWLRKALRVATQKAKREVDMDAQRFLELSQNVIKNVWAANGKVQSGINMVEKTGKLI